MVKFCSLFSGSSGNCLFLSAGSTKLLIEAGLSARKIAEALNSIGEDISDINAILVSHEHSDHIKGVGVLSRKFGIPVYANKSTWKAMEGLIGPLEEKNMVCFETGEAFSVGGDILVNTFPVPHDALEPVGFSFCAGGRKISIATDMGHVSAEVLDQLSASDLILVESNHDVEMLMVGPYPWHLKRRIMSDTGHLSNEMAGRLAAYLAERGTSRILLGHLSKYNNFPQLAYQTVQNALFEKNIYVGTDVMLDVALRDRTGSVIEL